MCTYRGGGQQPNIPDGEPDLGPNNDTTAEGLVYTNRAASLKPDSESIAGGGTPKNSSAGDKPDLGPYNDEYNLFGGKSTDSDWLSLKHISDCLELLLHTNYRYACHQPTTGSSHDVCSDRTLQNILDTAAEGRPFRKDTDLPQVIFDTLQADGSCPAIVVGDDEHWRVICIDSRQQQVHYIDPFGSGFLPTIKSALMNFYNKDRAANWDHLEWTHKLQHDGHNCGIWAIWIMEKWMQYWSQGGILHSFEDWCIPHLVPAPNGQRLRQHYWSLMKQAQRPGPNGQSAQAMAHERALKKRLRDTSVIDADLQWLDQEVPSASRMANQRNKQALHETCKEHMQKDANNEAASRWQTNAQRPTEIPDSPDIRATGNGHKQSRKVATTRLHRTGDLLSSLRTNTRMLGKIHKKPKLIHTASAGRLLSWLQGEGNTKNAGNVYHDRNEAGRQHNTTSSTTSCKLAPPDHSRHTHKPGSIQACFANATLKRNTAKQQPAPGNTVSMRSPTRLQKPPAEENITLDKEVNLQQEKIDSDCSISLDTTRKARKARQASTLSETCRAGTTSHTKKQPATTEEKKRKVAGAYHPRCDTLTILTWNVMGSTTVPDELMQIAQQRKPWIIVLTETKLTDARQDRVFFQEYLPEYTLYHSCVKGNDSGHCRTGSGGVAIAVHKSLTSQNSVKLIDHINPAAKSHLKTLKIKPPGSDCLTIWGVYLPSDNLQKRQELYQVITDCMRSEDKKASLAGLPMPYNIIAGDMNAALFKQDVQRAKPDAKDTIHQKFIRDLHLHTTDPDKHPHRQYSFRHTTDSSQDSRIDDKLVSESMCTGTAAHTEVLNTSGDADHEPILARIPLTCMKFLKPGPDPPPLPREPSLKTPVPVEDLKAFKEAFDQETGASTADLLQELDSTLELAYTVKETLNQDATLKTALASVGIGADTVERYNSILQEILQQILPIAQQTCKFSKGGPNSGFKLRSRCTSRKLEGLSKLRKSLHKVAMQHRDTKAAGKEACDDLRDLVQTELSKLPEQHRNSLPLPPRQNDRKSWQEYEELC